MKRIMTSLAAISAAVLSIALAATPAYAAASFPATAHAFFERLNPFDPSGCDTLKLDLQVTATTASADYWSRNTCFNFDSPHLTGSTAVASGQVSFDSFKSASATNIVIAVTGSGYFQQFTFNLVWTQDGHVTVAPPTDGTGQVTAQAPAAVTGSVVDLGGNHLFSNSDVSDAEITAVFHTLG
jgi:hypothetical protein